jgi:general secretion pathway protein I
MRPGRRGKDGFTLLEVMVAVVILALALSAIIGGFANSARNASELRQRTLAMIIAHNRLAEIELEASFPRTGRNDGRTELAGNEWRWYSEISETEDPALRRVDVRVTRIDSDHGLASLTGFLASSGRQQ